MSSSPAKQRRTISAPIIWLRSPAPLDPGARRLTIGQAIAVVGLVYLAYCGWPTVAAVHAMGQPSSPVTDWWSALTDALPLLGILLATAPSYGLLVYWLRARRSTAGLPWQAPTEPAKTTYILAVGLMLAMTLVYGSLIPHTGASPLASWPAVAAATIRLGYSSVVEELVVVAVPTLALTHARAPRWAIVATAMLLRGPYHLYHGWYALAWAAVWSGGLALLFLTFRRLLPLISAHMASNTIILGASLSPILLPHPLMFALAIVILVPTAFWTAMRYTRATTRERRPDSCR